MNFESWPVLTKKRKIETTGKREKTKGKTRSHMEKSRISVDHFKNSVHYLIILQA